MLRIAKHMKVENITYYGIFLPPQEGFSLSEGVWVNPAESLFKSYPFQNLKVVLYEIIFK